VHGSHRGGTGGRRRAADLAYARDTGRDRGCGEDLGDHTCSTQRTESDRGTVHTYGREPGGDRRSRSATDEGGSGGAGATGGDAARSAGARHDCAAASASGGGRATHRGRTAAAGPGPGRDRAPSAATHPGAGRDHTASTQRRAEHRRLELAGQRHRQNEREGDPLMLDFLLERCAAWAAIDMGARHATRQNPAPQRCEPLADLRARTVPRLATAQKPLAGLEYERLHLLLSDVEHGRDFSVRVIAELEQHERGALVSREPL
jgi:hypothetical protein